MSPLWDVLIVVVLIVALVAFVLWPPTDGEDPWDNRWGRL